MVIVSSDDEFMMFEWTSLWWDQMPGEKYLTILSNAEHSCKTGKAKLANAIAWFTNKIRDNDPRIHAFTSHFNETTGQVTVEMDEKSEKPESVTLRHTETMSSEVRDFRWVGLSDNGHCKFPKINVPKHPQLCL